MHDADAHGNDFFRCDFCRSPWDEQRPMVEGHRGSLICVRCLSLAYGELVLDAAGVGPREDRPCVLCLQTRQTAHWLSPLDETIAACRQCVEQSARILAKDPEVAWTPPSR